MTIRNLVIRNMPQRGIHAYTDPADHWTVEYNEIASNVIRASCFRVIPSSGTTTSTTTRMVGTWGRTRITRRSTNNEISYNGCEQKVMRVRERDFRNNFIHHNEGPGIWYDSQQYGRARRRQSRGG